MAEQINIDAEKFYKLELEINGKSIAAIMANVSKMPYDDVCVFVAQVNSQLIELTKIEKSVDIE